MCSGQKGNIYSVLKIALAIAILLTQILVPVTPGFAANGFSATAISDSQIRLEWIAVPNAQYYKIFRGSERTLLKTIDVNVDKDYLSYTDSSGLEPETEYLYELEAIAPSMDNLDTFTVSVKTLKMVSPTIESAVFDINEEEVTIKWKHNSPKAAGSVVKRADGTEIATIGGKSTTCTFKDAFSYNVPVKYIVASVDSAGGSSVNSAPVTILPIQAPTVSAVMKNSVATVSWDNTTTIGSFNLERARYEGSAWGSWSAVNTSLKSGSASVTDTPKSGGTYRYRLRAVSSSGYTGYSNISDTVTQPVAPTGLSCSIIDKDKIKLDWKVDPGNESELRIERKVDSGSYVHIATLPKATTSYTDVGALKLNSTYSYTVTAYDSANNLSKSQVSSITVGVPAAPSYLNLTVVSGTRIDLEWRVNSNNEQGFKIERKIDGGSYSAVGEVGAGVAKFSDTGITTGRTYTYRVYSYNTFGKSTQYSNEVSSTTSGLSSPRTLTVTPISPTQIKLDWTYPSSQKYVSVIERRKGNDQNWTVLKTVSSGVVTYTDTGLTSNTQYFYRVKSTSGSNTYSLPYPNDSTGKGAYTKLEKPTSLSGKAYSNTQIDLTWTDNSSDETGFVIERKTGTGKYSVIATTGANVRKWSDKGLITNTSYTYRIKAVTSNNASDYSDEVVVVSSLFAPPGVLSAVAVSDSSIELEWEDNSSTESGFEIWRKVGSSGSWKKITNVSRNTVRFLDDDLSENTQYYYRVRAYITSGNVFSDYSNDAYARTVVMDPPDDLNFNVVNDTRIELSWRDNSRNEEGFTVERKTGKNGKWEEIDQLKKDTTSLTVRGLTEGTVYFFRVKAYNNTYNRISYSDEIEVNTAVSKPPSHLTLEVLSPTEIRVRWDDNSNDETGFIIERREGNRSYREVGRVGRNIEVYIDEDLDPVTRYYYRVFAYNKNGKSPASEEEYETTYVAVTFKDIGGNFIWAKDAIENLASRGIIKGKPEGVYAPADTITRAEFTCLMLRTFKLSASISGVDAFGDVKSDKWFYSELMMAKKLGIISGDSKNNFYPESPITREDMTITIVKTMRAAGDPLPFYSTSVLDGFVDVSSISNEALYSVATLVGEGIMNGKPGSRIAPKDTSNRAEAAALIYRLLQNQQ